MQNNHLLKNWQLYPAFRYDIFDFTPHLCYNVFVKILVAGEIMAKNKKNKSSVTAAQRKAEKKAAEKAANRRGIIIVAVIVILFAAFIAAIAINGSNKNGNSGETTSATEYNEEAVMQALEDFEV